MDIQPQLGGSYTAIAGLIVSLVGYFLPGLSIDANQVVLIIGGVVALIGIVRQIVAHKQTVALANAAIATSRVQGV